MLSLWSWPSSERAEGGPWAFTDGESKERSVGSPPTPPSLFWEKSLRIRLTLESPSPGWVSQGH